MIEIRITPREWQAIFTNIEGLVQDGYPQAVDLFNLIGQGDIKRAKSILLDERLANFLYGEVLPDVMEIADQFMDEREYFEDYHSAKRLREKIRRASQD